MYNLADICHVHLEISSLCNAACPLCPRNFYGYEFNDGYVERNMTLAEVKQIFQPKFVQQLREILINGNFGDSVMNPETVDIVEYFRSCSSDLMISISTNAGARNQEYWESLAKLRIRVVFCIDGLEDTHSLYRRNTLYSTVIQNAKIFIAAGGDAVWKMIDFDHNRHQQADAQRLSQQLGFKSFWLHDQGRNQAPVFDKNKKLSHTIGSPVEINFDRLWKSRTQNEVLLQDIIPNHPLKNIHCRVKKQKSIYISSTGDVSPCCWLGFSPKTYGHGNYHEAVNAQFRDFVQENNALEHSLEHCITWFNKIEKTWSISTFEAGRLVICNDMCGADSNK
jgi:sulfatase maturation enzyme AslB (radical SAM superfamily)